MRSSLADRAKAELELRRRLSARGSAAAPPVESYREFVSRAHPQFEWARHHLVIADVLERVVAGELTRVMVFMPPRSGKSEQMSRLFPAYALRRHPGRWCAVTSYGASLANGFSRAARRNYVGFEALASDARAVSQWETGRGGGLWAAGVGGAAVGKGFHFGIIDDPVKDAKSAHSEVVRETTREWYQGVFYTRQQPGAAIVVGMTRWHMADLAGWLIERERGGDQPEGWHFVVMPAIYEGPPDWIPDGCTFEPDWREPGEALWPERYPLEVLERIRANVGSYVWQAQYQQRPVPREGRLVKWDWFKQVEAAPADVLCTVRGWDVAGTDGDGDNTAGVRLSIDPQGRVFVEHCEAGQWSVARRDATMAAVAARDARERPGTVTWIGRDTGIGGDDRTMAMVRALHGYAVHVEPETGSKEARFEAFASQAEAGNVHVVVGRDGARADWVQPWLEELCDFPGGRHDDRVDATGRAYNRAASMLQSAASFEDTYHLIGV